MLPDLVSSPTASLVVSTSTIAAGCATGFEWVPPDIGFFASALGAVLSIVFIYNNVLSGVLNRRKLRGEIAELQRKSKIK